MPHRKSTKKKAARKKAPKKKAAASDGYQVTFAGGVITIMRDEGSEVQVFVDKVGRIGVVGEGLAIIPVASNMIHIV